MEVLTFKWWFEILIILILFLDANASSRTICFWKQLFVETRFELTHIILEIHLEYYQVYINMHQFKKIKLYYNLAIISIMEKLHITCIIRRSWTNCHCTMLSSYIFRHWSLWRHDTYCWKTFKTIDQKVGRKSKFCISIIFSMVMKFYNSFFTIRLRFLIF